MWRRVTWLLALLLPLALTSAAPADAGQPGCDEPQPLPTGRWAGRFEVQWDLRWTAELGNQPTSADTAPATWQSKRTMQGEIDLIVGDSAIEGVARASYRTDTTAEREDGARRESRENGLLSGGSLSLPSGRDLAAGQAIEWRGAWWTRPAGTADANFSMTFTARSNDGRTLFGDGHVVARPAGPLAFQVASVTCRRITGTIDPAAFGYPQLGPEAGLTVVNASATFTLDRR